MNLWEINKEILSCIDMETGEITDAEKLESLQMDRHEKLRNIAFVALNAESDIKQLKEQEAKFKARRQSAEKTLEWAKNTLESELAGDTMKENEFTVSYNPASVDVFDVALLDRKYFRVPEIKPQEPKPDLDAIKKAIQAGVDVPGARLRRKVKIK